MACLAGRWGQLSEAIRASLSFPIVLSLLSSSSLLALAAIPVLEPDDIVLAEIGARLHFDDEQRNLSRVLDAVLRAEWDVRGLVFFEQERLLATRDPGGP